MAIDIAEIKKYANVGDDFDINVLTPHLTWATNTYVPYVLGYDLTQGLKYYLQSPVNYTAQQKAYYDILNTMLNEMIIKIAMFDWMAISGVSISELGLKRIEGEISGMTRKSAFQYQEKNAKEYFRNKGFNAMDAVLKFLMGCFTVLTEFTTSPAYADLHGSIIPDTSTFNKYYDIGGSMLLFMRLSQYIREAELFDIVPCIGNAFYQRIKANIGTTDIITLLPELRSAIAYKAIARGIEATSINIAEDGARLILKESNRDNIEVSTKPNLSSLIKSANASGDNYIGLFCRNIRANQSKYPEYIDSRVSPLDITNRKFVPFY